MGKVLGYGRVSQGDGQDVASQKVAAGGRTVHLQLLASPFYEALRRETTSSEATEFFRYQQGVSLKSVPK